jgi:hypothetical protein
MVAVTGSVAGLEGLSPNNPDWGTLLVSFAIKYGTGSPEMQIIKSTYQAIEPQYEASGNSNALASRAHSLNLAGCEAAYGSTSTSTTPPTTSGRQSVGTTTSTIASSSNLGSTPLTTAQVQAWCPPLQAIITGAGITVDT